jgi:hypothetical protein
MEILLTLTSVAICVAIFKIFRIPANQWASATLGGNLRACDAVHHDGASRKVRVR